MGAEPFASGDPAFLADLPDDLFGSAGTGPDEADFWTEADQARPGTWASTVRPRRHRRPGRAPAAGAAAAGTGPTRRWSGRLAAAWAAESSARRALRSRPAGAPKEPGRGRKIAAAAVAVLALFAVGVAAADLVTHDRSTSDDASADAAGLAPGGAASTDGTTDDDVRTSVQSKVVDAARTDRVRPASRPVSAKPTTPTTTRPTPTTPPKPSGAAPPTPAPATPAPVTAAPPTAPVAPAAPTTAPPTTAPPAKPTVQAFTATAATSPGGSCPALQWATTLRWNTTGATTVAITGLLEQTQSSLPADGSKTVCRALPGGPLGGWTLTATGPGGTTTATA